MTEKAIVHGNTPFISSDVPDADLDQLRGLLLHRRRIDLGMYNNPCIRRRLAKRVRSLGLSDIANYLNVLRRDERELDALLSSLTVHVSQFFRNPSTFAALAAQVLPDLIARVRAADRREIRVWSVGCAAGEEPYSLALLLDEAAPEIRVSILGTDLSREVLEHAREGLYDATRLAEMPAESQDRYFRREGESFRLDRRIRCQVRFEQHNILAPGDYPPADLILCRNVLIYFSRVEQERTLCRFADCLSPEGILVLGRTETLSGAARLLFNTEDPAERIYRRSG